MEKIKSILEYIRIGLIDSYGENGEHYYYTRDWCPNPEEGNIGYWTWVANKLLEAHYV
jgi:hypothetical protein